MNEWYDDKKVLKTTLYTGIEEGTFKVTSLLSITQTTPIEIRTGLSNIILACE